MKNSKTRVTAALASASAAVAVTLLAADPDHPRRKAWQHLALHHALGEKPAELARRINTLGEDGWELVSVDSLAKDGTTTKSAHYFKRSR